MGFDDPIMKAIDKGGGQECDVAGVLRELKSRGYAIVPKEPTDAQVISALDWALEWMRQHKVDGLSPFKDYPPVGDTTRGMYRAMILAANQ